MDFIGDAIRYTFWIYAKADHEIRSQIVTSKTAGGGFCGFPLSGFRCCEHFGKKVVNMFIHNLGVADLDPISKSNFDPFL